MKGIVIIIVLGAVVGGAIWFWLATDKRVKWALAFAIPATLATVFMMTGAGGFKRMVTVSGIYPILRPGGYDVVCFADSDGSEGGLSCLPCKLAKCKSKK